MTKLKIVFVWSKGSSLEGNAVVVVLLQERHDGMKLLMDVMMSYSMLSEGECFVAPPRHVFGAPWPCRLYVRMTMRSVEVGRFEK